MNRFLRSVQDDSVPDGLLKEKTQNGAGNPRPGPGFFALAAAIVGFVVFGPAMSGFAQQADKPPAPHPDRNKQRSEGQRLFLHNWLQKGKINKTGDGLGPMYNAVSCVACHRQKGVGGGGDNRHNVELLSLQTSPSARRAGGRGEARSQRFFKSMGKKVHPGFAAGRTSLILHKHSTDSYGAKEAYHDFRRQFLPPAPKDSQPPPRGWWRWRKRREGVPVILTQRNTPALFGAGLIDRIPDKVFIEVAAEQQKLKNGISGRIPQTNRGAIGRFGWRGQTATLHDFVLGACANELGLEVPGQQQPRALHSSAGGTEWQLVPRPQEVALDLTEEQCRSLTVFIASLPAPQRARKVPLPVAQRAYRGEKLFQAIGCAVCHRPEMGGVQGLYSDLLLHDMGPKLSDPLAAVPEINEKTAPGFSGVASYYGADLLPQIARITTKVRREWRTPPLWGVADSAPYLHDGRAGSLEEAILWHGGEATSVLQRFRRLPRRQQDEIITFLTTLVAPASSTRPGFGGIGAFGSRGGGFFSSGAFCFGCCFGCFSGTYSKR